MADDFDYNESLDDFKGNIKVNTQILINPSDWTIETILSLLRNGRININPEFQRRSAWNTERKSLFIESILLNYPLPQIILAEDVKNKKFIVVDGKQRLLTLLQFAEKEDQNINNNTKVYERFKLKGLERLSELNGKYYTDIQEDLTLQNYISSFNDFTIRTIVLKQWDRDALYDMFLRINQNSVILMPQELRQALFPGPFSNFIDQASSQSNATRYIYGSTKPDPRMRDAELLLRFYAIRNFLTPNYNGNLKDLLDYTCEFFNNSWDENEKTIYQQLSRFEEGFNFISEVFLPSINPFGKYEGGIQITRFNRAVFDFMMYYFSDPNIINAIKSNLDYKMLLRNAFKDVFTDTDFLFSVTSTTKSRTAFKIRFTKWAEILSTIANTEIKSPL